MTSRWYVYELADPRTDKVFYVGKGSGNRIDQHEREAAQGVCSHKCNTINNIIQSGAQIIKRKVKMFTCELSAYEYEAELIEHYGLENLTNVDPGGQGPMSKVRLPRVVQPEDAKKFIVRYSHIILHWAKETKGGTYKVKALPTESKLMDAYNEMMAFAYNELIPKLLATAEGEPWQPAKES